MKRTLYFLIAIIQLSIEAYVNTTTTIQASNKSKLKPLKKSVITIKELRFQNFNNTDDLRNTHPHLKKFTIIFKTTTRSLNPSSSNDMDKFLLRTQDLGTPFNKEINNIVVKENNNRSQTIKTQDTTIYKIKTFSNTANRISYFEKTPNLSNLRNPQSLVKSTVKSFDKNSKSIQYGVFDKHRTLMTNKGNTTKNIKGIARRNEWLDQDAFYQMQEPQQNPVAQQYPVVSQQFPGLPQQYPRLPNQYPESPQQYPGRQDQYPGPPQQYPEPYPETAKQYPEVQPHYPIGPQQYPGEPQPDFPEAPHQYPEAPQDPIASQQYPARPHQYPNAPHQYPGESQQYPGLPQQNPNAQQQYPGRQNPAQDDAAFAALLEKYRGMVNKYGPDTPQQAPQNGRQNPQNYRVPNHNPGQQKRYPLQSRNNSKLFQAAIKQKLRAKQKGALKQREEAKSPEMDSEEKRNKDRLDQEGKEDREEVVEPDELDKHMKEQGLTTADPVNAQTMSISTGAADAEKHRFTTLPSTTSRRKRRTTPKRVSLAEDCDYLAYYCLKAYDTGLICGRTAWYVHMTFQNYCMLDYVNCMERYDIWQIAHMGECFVLKVLTEYKFYPYNDDYFLDNYYIVEDM